MFPIVTYFPPRFMAVRRAFDSKRAQKHILSKRRRGQSRLGGGGSGAGVGAEPVMRRGERRGEAPGGPRAGGQGRGDPGHRDGSLIAAALTLKKLSLKCQMFPTPFINLWLGISDF